MTSVNGSIIIVTPASALLIIFRVTGKDRKERDMPNSVVQPVVSDFSTAAGVLMSIAK